jgi:hypothetical protein
VVTTRNPYESAAAVDSPSETAASIGFVQIARASMLQFGATFGLVELMMGIEAQQLILGEYLGELNTFSTFMLVLTPQWPFVAVFLILIAFGSLIYYRRLDGQPVSSVRCWWYVAGSSWFLVLLVLLAGTVPPLYSAWQSLAAS